ncbi:serine/threonine-protein kinase PRP4 homolog isoform X2 [Leguminivora glycinivorella]|uniref:serine/threonine-protein kinase PRP4 homolog isoform X2 n=1 Tax=Leguminivora glycinivorella TaxID=1035111 RepID=UPI00200DC108|nr:serine/threonine-protein kinase PRP4 homolog isoform X2 [Leguminivora glycinivorella]
MGHYINQAISIRNKLTTSFSLSHNTNTHKSRYRSKHVSTAETRKRTKKRTHKHSKFRKPLETTQQLNTGESITKTKDTNEKIEMLLTESLGKFATRVKNITNEKSDKNLEGAEGEEDTSRESKIGISDADGSSEDTGLRLELESKNEEVLRERGKKYKHRQRHKHKKHKGHKHPHYGKRKYERLKRKYIRLKEILAAQNEKSEESKKSKAINSKEADFIDRYDKPKSFEIRKKADADFKYHAEDSTPVLRGVRERHLRTDKINIFLEDYDIKASIEEDIDPESFTIRNHGVYRKSLQQNPTIVFDANDSTDIEKEIKENIKDAIQHDGFVHSNVTRNPAVVFDANDSTDIEKELKKNINDAIRHEGFVHSNVSSSSYHNDNASTARFSESPETDVEAVLKSNIFKAVKKLLKK